MAFPKLYLTTNYIFDCIPGVPKKHIQPVVIGTYLFMLFLVRPLMQHLKRSMNREHEVMG